MGATLIFEVKAEFVRLLQSSTDFLGRDGAPVQVSYGHPGPTELEDEAIWIGESAEWDQDWAVVGDKSRKESFDLVVRFVAGRANQETMESEQRVAELLEAAQLLVIDQRNFPVLRTPKDGRQLTSIILVPKSLDPLMSDSGRVAAVEALLRVKGRI